MSSFLIQLRPINYIVVIVIFNHGKSSLSELYMLLQIANAYTTCYGILPFAPSTDNNLISGCFAVNCEHYMEKRFQNGEKNAQNLNLLLMTKNCRENKTAYSIYYYRKKY